ncbi:hypothetical protein F4819DRAFT_145779 [Hypoxylon fuscum]|nr:hypothetical protein F4819DRAFT_145779 [Hypoxylon fuscum]
MSLLTEFPSFPDLPPELRLAIWEFSILDHNRDRLVPICSVTKGVIRVTHILACSPHFRAASESREVAKHLYPIQLPVFVVPEKRKNNRLIIGNYDDGVQKGVIYISTDRDIIAISPYKLAIHDLDGRDRATRHSVYKSCYGLRSASLTPPQCQSVRRVLLFDLILEKRLKAGCRRTLSCIIRCGAMKYNLWHDENVFRGVQECLYAVVGNENLEPLDVYRYVQEEPSHMALKLLEERHSIIWFDEAEMRRHVEDLASACVCDAA